ncbi:MAG: OmpA family protein [Chitinophagaceae bacterium]|nr:OmpA family protein [Chitinophagaceae bacterium]
MASKKFKLLLLGVFSLMSGALFAQNTGVFDVNNSAVIPEKGQAQHNEFMNNAYDFPAQPRNQWELGISGGLFSESSDVSAKLPTFGFGVHVRKALGYLFSLRLQYSNGTAKGLNWKPSTGYANNSAWSAYAPGSVVYYNYKANIQDLSLQGIITLNNIRFHKAKSGIVMYGGAGVGATIFDVNVNALNGNSPYNFSSISNSGYTKRKDIRNALKNMMDDSYETPAQNNKKNEPQLFGRSLKPSANVLFGVAFKLGERVNLAIEDRWTMLKTDLLDGQQWQEHTNNDPVQTRDFDSYNYLSVGLNFNLGKNSVQPLWWLNPLDYAYSELNNPKHMKLPKPVLDDEDGDGVTDQFDKCPGTPAGVKVDVNGCPLDTDGDGVPDYKDKELITPTYCFPVDENGVGKCPDPECCKNIVVEQPVTCAITSLPSINFSARSATLSRDAKAMLATAASQLRNNPECTITITGYPEASKTSQSNCNKRVSAIMTYLTETEGISADRVQTSCEVGGGPANTVDLRVH